MLDVVCTHAAGADLAIADFDFSAMTDSASGKNVVDVLKTMFQRAKQEFPDCPETEGFVALMEYQMARIVVMGMLVRISCPLYSTKGFAVG